MRLIVSPNWMSVGADVALVAKLAAARGISVGPRPPTFLSRRQNMCERRTGKYSGFTGKKTVISVARKGLHSRV